MTGDQQRSVRSEKERGDPRSFHSEIMAYIRKYEIVRVINIDIDGARVLFGSF